MIDLDALEAAARAAHTPGEWAVYSTRTPHKYGGAHVENSIGSKFPHPQLKAPAPVVCRVFGVGAESGAAIVPLLWLHEDDAAHIATANPAAVLALIAELRQARKDAERYRYLRNRVPAQVLGQVKSAAGCWIDGEDEEGVLILLTGNDADAAIDAAMQQEQQG